MCQAMVLDNTWDWEDVEGQSLREGQVLTPCLWVLKLREESGGGVLVPPGMIVVLQVHFHSEDVFVCFNYIYRFMRLKRTVTVFRLASCRFMTVTASLVSASLSGCNIWSHSSLFVSTVWGRFKKTLNL